MKKKQNPKESIKIQGVQKREKSIKPIAKKPVDQIYDYLLKHEGGTPSQLAQALSLDLSDVRAALRELRVQGRIKLERPLTIPPTPVRVVPLRVPERIKKKVEEKLEKARTIQLKVQEKQEEIKRKRK